MPNHPYHYGFLPKNGFSLLKIKNANQQHQQTTGRVVEVGTNTPAISHSDEWLW